MSTVEKEVKKFGFMAERIAEHFPIDKEERITTMDRPVIIESACPGWQHGGTRYPAVPISIKDQVQEAVDSVRAGAIANHMHPRDPDTGLAQANPSLLKRILEQVFDQVGDVVTLSHTWAAIVDTKEIDYISDTDELLQLGGGNKYCQGSVVLPIGYVSNAVGGAVHTKNSVVEGVKWLQAHKVKPIYQLYDTYTIWDVKHKLLDTSIATGRPHVFNLHMGKHHSHTIHADPWSYMQLITNYNMANTTAPGSIIGVYPGGRNWLPIVVLGLLMGAELIRVGIEDCYWVYPHKDDIIRKNSDMVKLLVDIAQLLGRSVVTDATEARSMLGMKLTSSL